MCVTLNKQLIIVILVPSYMHLAGLGAKVVWYILCLFMCHLIYDAVLVRDTYLAYWKVASEKHEC
jgi:hypothetical protein